MPIIKTAGLSGLFFCISLAGVFAAKNLNERAKTVDIICNCITKYQTLMLHSNREIKSIIPESFAPLKMVEFENGKAVFSGSNPLKKGDIALLEEFFCSVGTDLKHGEKQKCEMYLQSFCRIRKEALKTAKEKQKIYVVGGICSALAAVVVLI